MAYAVYHSSKGTASGAALGNHIDRIEGREYSYKSADPHRRHLNKHYHVNDYCKMPFSEAVEKRIQQGYKSDRTIRKNAVRYLTHIFSGSHERMLEIFGDEKLRVAWIQKNYDWACKEFGKDNIIRFTIHLDEKTPHLHCVTVPITPDGRLSAKEMLGNKKKLIERQSSYGDLMYEFGLDRGRSSDKKHITTKQWEAAMEQQKDIEQGMKNAIDSLYRQLQDVDEKYKTKMKLTIQEQRKSLKEAENDLKRHIEGKNKWQGPSR